MHRHLIRLHMHMTEALLRNDAHSLFIDPLGFDALNLLVDGATQPHAIIIKCAFVAAFHLHHRVRRYRGQDADAEPASQDVT